MKIGDQFKYHNLGNAMSLKESLHDIKSYKKKETSILMEAKPRQKGDIHSSGDQVIDQLWLCNSTVKAFESPGDILTNKKLKPDKTGYRRG